MDLLWVQGVVIAFSSSLFFALYVVPRKYSKISPIVFSFYVGFGFFLVSLISYGIQQVLGLNTSSTLIGLGIFQAILIGITWTTGLICLLSAIDHIGLASSNQWKNLQGPIGVLGSLFFLGEAARTNSFFALLSGVFIFIAAYLFTIPSLHKKAIDHIGVIYSLFAAICFGLTTVLNKFANDSIGIAMQQLIWSATIIVFLGIILGTKGGFKAFRAPRRDILLGMVGGMLYWLSSFTMLASYQFIPVSVAFTIIQLNTLWVVAMGIGFFREINLSRYWRRILFGVLLSIAGVLLLALTK